MAKQLKLIVEALLFASDSPLNAPEIHTWLDHESLSDIKQILKELKTEYDNMGRSFILKEVAHGYQFRTRSEYAPHILMMLKASPARLSRAALETLAIVAYKQPVLRQEIERLRGVDVGGILRTLMEKGLIKIAGRKTLPGRPLIYGTTKKFLEVFDLKDLQSLPKLREIKDLGFYEQGTEASFQRGGQDGEPKEPISQAPEENDAEDGSKQA